MSNYDEVWKDGPSIAMPDSAVHKYRQLIGTTVSDEEIREFFVNTVQKRWSARVALSRNWGHQGYALKVDTVRAPVWLIFNPDRKTHHDFVLVTVYTNEQFSQRMNGDYFTDSEAPVSPERFIHSMKSEAPMSYRVECNGKSKDLEEEGDVLSYLQDLIRQGFSSKDWVVWKKVKTNITLEG